MNSLSKVQFLVICALLMMARQVAGNDPASDEANVVTVYTIKCYEGELVGDECVGGFWLTNQQEKYRVLIEHQAVVSWFPSLSEVSPVKHTDCAIASLDHWTCRYSDNSGEFGFRSGKYFSEFSRDTSTEQTEKSRKFWGQMTVDKERWLAVQERGEEAILEHRRQQEN